MNMWRGVPWLFLSSWTVCLEKMMKLKENQNRDVRVDSFRLRQQASTLRCPSNRIATIKQCPGNHPHHPEHHGCGFGTDDATKIFFKRV